MAQITHFLHRHPLVLTEVINDKVVCSGCLNPLAGQFYGCSDCKFYLHKSCVELPAEIQNFFHPCPLVLHIFSYMTMCNACFKDVSGFRYHCEKCNFDMHVKCTQRREEVIHHFTHEHPLALIHGKNDLKVVCGICEEPCSNSSDSSVYGCQECNFFLHTSCMINIPPQVNHFFHPSGLLTLYTSYGSYNCHACDKPHYGPTLVFHCGRCEFNLDVKCALLPTVESKDAEEIQHFGHRHPLALRESKEFGNEVWRRACGKSCSGLCYVCERCNFFLHRDCAVEFPLETEIHHPFHPTHSLTLSPLPWYPDQVNPCRAWAGCSDRFMLTYHCAKCDFNLLIDCAQATPEHTFFKYDGHLHFLSFCNKTRDKIYCDICDWPICNCFLRCVQCEFNIHLYCFPSTTKTIKHESHLHPLTLTKSPFEFELNISKDKYNSDDEFYCDVCEEKRFKAESVYYCEECKFIAEIPCVKSKLFPSLIASKCQSRVDGRAIPKNEENSVSEAAIAEINDEIAALSAKEKPLEAEIERLQKELKPIKQKLDRLKKIHLRYSDQLYLNMNESF